MIGFRFNTHGAILGRFKKPEVSGDRIDLTNDSEEVSLPCNLTHYDFIATRLLPCGLIDTPIKKFTGNHDEGGAPGRGDYLTTVLHAFAHYVGIFSRGNLLLCDLQGMGDCTSWRQYSNVPQFRLGMFDKSGTLCLIDPQSHS